MSIYVRNYIQELFRAANTGIIYQGLRCLRVKLYEEQGGFTRMKSQWFEREVAQVEEFRKEQRKKTPRSMAIMAGFFIILAGVAFFYGQSHPDYNTVASCGILLGMGAFVLLIALLAAAVGRKKVGLPKLEKELDELLTTPELIEEFDYEMMNTPLHTLSGDSSIFFTEHYLVNIWGHLGTKEYTFIRLDKVAMTKLCAMRDSTSVTGLGKVYYVDLCDSNKKKIGGVTIQKRANMQEFDEALLRYCPGIQLARH